MNRLVFPAVVLGVIIGLFLFLSILVDSTISGSTVSEFKKGKVEEKIVTKIIDGDTIIVQGGEKVRLLGIDCDERGKPCYTKAKQYIEELLLNKKVKLEAGIEDKDRYYRSLRFIFLNNENINERLVREGYCVARFEGNQINYQTEIKKAEEYAIKNKVGCKWS